MRPLLLTITLLLTACTTANTPPQTTIPTYHRGIIAADHEIGSQAGLEMLKLGGNAVDAAVATSFCQAVVRPYSCGLGGGGFMLIHLAPHEKTPAQNTALNYRETAPSTVGPTYYVNLKIEKASRYGPHASGIPGTVAGLLHALETYGTLDRATVLAPAIRAAESGFPIDDHYVQAVHNVLNRLEKHPEIRNLIEPDRFQYLYDRFFFDGQPESGQILRQPELAKTLRTIADEGASAFYTGHIAESLTKACPQITTDDLAEYSVQTTKPLIATRFNRRFLTMPPPSSGGIATLQILGILEHHSNELTHMSHNEAPYIHLITEAMKHAFADRAQWLADPNYVNIPITQLLDNDYIAELNARIDPTQTYDPPHYGSRADTANDAGTSHLSVIDRWGNAVACTETINLEFGSLNTIPELGIILNNEMDDFVTEPGEPNAFGLVQSDRNLPAPGKRPLSSMSPTIVLDADGHVELIAGASGGPRIITGTLQVILNSILFDMNSIEAVAQPRFHHQWLPNTLWFEKAWPNESVLRTLQSLGHEIKHRTSIGNVQLIQSNNDGAATAASDPRKGGKPAGW